MYKNKFMKILTSFMILMTISTTLPVSVIATAITDDSNEIIKEEPTYQENIQKLLDEVETKESEVIEEDINENNGIESTQTSENLNETIGESQNANDSPKEIIKEVPEELKENFVTMKELMDMASFSEQEKAAIMSPDFQKYLDSNPLNTLRGTRASYTLKENGREYVNMSRIRPNGMQYLHDYIVRWQIDGEDVFCLQEGVFTANGINYTSKADLSSLVGSKAKRLVLIGYFGYYSTGKTMTDYVLTQMMIWDEFGGSFENYGEIGKTSYSSFVTKVNSAVNDFSLRPSWHNTTVKVKTGETVRIKDTTGKFAAWNGTITDNTAGVTVKKDGNDLLITASNTSKDGTFYVNKLNPTGNGIKSDYAYTNGNTQNIGRLTLSDPGKALLKVTVEKEGNVRVRKVDEAGNPLAGAIYKATRLDTNVSKNITSNANGYAAWNNLPSGTKVRFIEQTSPTGYVIDKTPIDVVVVTGTTTTKQHKNSAQMGTLTLKKSTTNSLHVSNDRYSLEGNSFNVYAGKTATGTPVTTLKTSKTGEAISKNLPLGFYTIVETAAGNGLVLNKTPKTVELKYAGQTIDVTNVNVPFENKEQVGTITVNKTVKDVHSLFGQGNYTLAGNKFYIYKGQEVTGSSVQTLVTDAKGQAISASLPLGYYTIVEVSTSSGLVLNPTPYVINLTYAGQTIEVTNQSQTIENLLQEGELEIFKRDSDTGVLLTGAEFSIKDGKGKEYATGLKTDNNGRMVVKHLPVNVELTVTETKAPTNYVLNTKSQKVTIKSTNATEKVFFESVSFVNDIQRFKAILNKVDSETGKLPQGQATYQGAIYELRYADADEALVKVNEGNGRYTTDINGQISVSNLKVGTKYYWQEVKAPIGYLLDGTKHYFEATYADQTVATAADVKTTHKEQVVKGHFDIVKYGNYGWLTTAWNWVTGKTPDAPVLLEGVEFTVTQNFGKKEVVAKGKTDKLGYLKFSNLPYGQYKVEESGVPEGYHAIKPFYVTVNENNKTTHFSLENKVKESQLKVVKVDADTGKTIPRADAGFSIFSKTTGKQLVMKDEEGNDQSTFFTNEQGELLVPTPLAYGEYQLKEVQAPHGYVLSEEIVDFSVTGDELNNVVIIRFKDKAQMAQVELHKVVKTATSLKETQTEYGSLTTIHYTYENGEGFEFKVRPTEDIYTEDGTLRLEVGQFVQHEDEDVTLVTDAEGHATSPVVFYPGKYELVETKAPNGVVMLKEAQAFEIEYAGQLIEVTSETVSIENEVQELKVLGYKSQEVVTDWQDGKPVIELEAATNGQVFALRNKEDQTIGEAVLKADTTLGYMEVVDGLFVFDGYLPEGTYYVVEIEAGSAHVLNEEQYEFEYKAQDNLDSQTIHVWSDSVAINKQGFTRIARNPIINTLARQSVELIKVDKTNYVTPKALEGVSFDLFKTIEDEEDRLISQHKTDKDGKISVENLPMGTYYFVETKALDGYILNDEHFAFEVKPETDGQLIEIEATNEREEPTLGTNLTSIDGDKLIDALTNNTLVDTLDYTNMILGEDEVYDIHFELWEYGAAKDGSQDVKVAESIEKNVHFETKDGDYKMLLELAKGKIDPGKRYYAKEYVYRRTKENPTPEDPFVKHDDREDLNQTIRTKKAPLPQTGSTDNLDLMLVGLMSVMSAGLLFMFIKKREEELI